MDDVEFCTRLGIDVTVIQVWIGEGWLRPEMSGEMRAFRPTDVARAQLILDLTRRMGVNDAGVDVVMDLIDQIHGLRGTMSAVLSAIEKQDDETRSRIVRILNGTAD
jgi:chaperone modulatory protein CbpM